MAHLCVKLTHLKNKQRVENYSLDFYNTLPSYSLQLDWLESESESDSFRINSITISELFQIQFKRHQFKKETLKKEKTF